MLLKFTQEFFLQVVPEWYVKDTLSGEGTLEEQICEYERQRAEKDGMYFANLKQGATGVEVVQDFTEKPTLCNGLDVPHISGLHPDQCADCANTNHVNSLEDNVGEDDKANSVSQEETAIPHSDNSQKEGWFS